MRRRDLLIGSALAIPALRAAQAQDWAPNRPINLIVPLAAGGSADILGRALAEVLATRLGQAVTVDNRPTAGGVLATEQLKNAPPDGHTIGLVSQGTLIFNSFLTAQPRYDSVRDFAPIAMASAVSNAVVVARNSPFRSPQDLVAAARARPGRITYSSGGIGTSHHISMALFAQMTGVEMSHVPYRATTAGILAAMTGEVDVGSFNIPTVLPQIRAGELRPLAVTSAGRSEFLPEVPSLQELGFTGYELTAWVGICAPARTPQPITARLMAETYRALDDAAVWDRLRQLGFERMPRLDPAGFTAYVQAELAKWGPVIRASGATSG